jgi:hypothetical protein
MFPFPWLVPNLPAQTIWFDSRWNQKPSCELNPKVQLGPQGTDDARSLVGVISVTDLRVGHVVLNWHFSLQFTAINLTNKVALYNFLSTFSGKHYVTPRALTAQIGFQF